MDVIEIYKAQYEGAFNGPEAEEAVDELLAQFGVVNSVYRSWLVQTGGGPIGADWYDGLAELMQSQEKLRNEDWSISGFVIGWDGAGNPIAINNSGQVVTEDHNFGGVHQLAPNFKKLLASNVSS
ncbi:MAG: SMI1/KNR4 family protein [Oleiphilaceae bacterium]|nr:SMI1/KNR4 family protein [Oleiphilaceae bacterium]